jgi:uncharacterized circularly permuted ATP-grasp superfamily protein
MRAGVTAGPGYVPGLAQDEHVAPDGTLRPLAEALWRHLALLGPRALVERQDAAEAHLHGLGVTFGATEASGMAERPWPFDVIPRILAAAEWSGVETGLTQRLVALNMFIDDCYHSQRAVRDGVVPVELVLGSANFRPECVGAHPAGGLWAHVCGSDLVRDRHGTVMVLEDNLRVPSGASYMLENRMAAKRIFPELFRAYSVEPVDLYPTRLASLLRGLAPVADPTVVVLTPGVYNSAYFEHSFMARRLGAELVTSADLVVGDDDVLLMRTIDGLRRVDVVYRRIDDLYLDPEVFRRDSLIGVPGLVRAWRSGQVALVNAPGAGVADDKGLYPFVPDLIRYFLGEEPLLAQVPTFRCAEPSERSHVLAHLDELVVKPVNESGGYGIVIGPQAGPEALEVVARRIEHHPAGWVAQPVIDLSTVPTLCEKEVAPRHVDLRPFALLGPSGVWVTPGGLTRVARREGSLIVNSSQGGGSKDTWIVDAVAGMPADAQRFVPLEATDGGPRPHAQRAWSPARGDRADQ